MAARFYLHTDTAASARDEGVDNDGGDREGRVRREDQEMIERVARDVLDVLTCSPLTSTSASDLKGKEGGGDEGMQNYGMRHWVYAVLEGVVGVVVPELASSRCSGGAGSDGEGDWGDGVETETKRGIAELLAERGVVM